MIKKYYQSLNSLLYGPFMTPLVFLVFALAFFYEKKGIQELRYAMMVGTAILGVILVMYYTKKFKISRALKSIRNIEEYEKGGGLDVISMATRLTCFTSFTIRVEILSSTSYGILAQSAVIPSIDVTARITTV